MIGKQQSCAWALALGVTVSATAALAQNTTSLTHTLVLDNLKNPWDMAFLDDGTMFYTEKCKGLSVLMPSGETKALLGMAAPRDMARPPTICSARARLA